MYMYVCVYMCVCVCTHVRCVYITSNHKHTHTHATPKIKINRSRPNIVGVLIVKNIILVDPHSYTKVKDVSKFAVRKIPRVASNLPLFELLHFFGQGRSHLALVCTPDEHGVKPLDM